MMGIVAIVCLCLSFSTGVLAYDASERESDIVWLWAGFAFIFAVVFASLVA